MNTNKNHFSPLRAGVQAKCLSLLILATITLAPGAAEVAPRLGSGGDYLPPPPGRYSYRITRAGTNLVKTILVGSAQVEGETAYFGILEQDLKADNPFLNGGVWFKDQAGVAIIDCGFGRHIHTLLASQKQRLLDLPIREGALTRVVSSEGTITRTRIIEGFETLAVPAGRFEQCLRAGETSVWNTGERHTQRIWLAKGIGVVKREVPEEKWTEEFLGFTPLPASVRPAFLSSNAKGTSESRDWNEAQRRPEVSSFKYYLENHPGGKRAPEARRRYVELCQKEAETSARTWKDLTRGKVRAVRIESRQGSRPLNVIPVADLRNREAQVIDVLKSAGLWAEDTGSYVLRIHAEITYIALRTGNFTCPRGSFNLEAGFTIDMTKPPSFSGPIQPENEGYAEMPFAAFPMVRYDLLGTPNSLDSCKEPAAQALRVKLSEALGIKGGWLRPAVSE